MTQALDADSTLGMCVLSSIHSLLLWAQSEAHKASHSSISIHCPLLPVLATWYLYLVFIFFCLILKLFIFFPPLPPAQTLSTSLGQGARLYYPPSM